jgi:hypothetical protein
MLASRTRFVAVFSGCLIAGLVAASAGHAAAPVSASGDGMLVLIDGCDGFVAAGGIPPNAPSPFPTSWTHNFLASWDQRLQQKFTNDGTFTKTETDITLNAQGTDDAGHSFAIRAKLTRSFFASPELWADDGIVRIRRDDGATLTGSAVGAFEHVFDPIFTNDTILEVTATSCSL